MAEQRDLEVSAPPPGWGFDRAPQARPGVPREWTPHPDPGAHWITPEWQRSGERRAIEGSGLRRVTPVFGTAQPAHGVSGLVRRLAYRYPDYRVRRWFLLVAADRVEALGARARRLAGPAPVAALALITFGLVVRELGR